MITASEIIEGLQGQTELIPEQHDGSYQLMNETIEAYSHIDNTNILDCTDFDLIYLMAVISSTDGIESKKNRVRSNEHLSEQDKNHLLEVLDEVWNKAVTNQYSNKIKATVTDPNPRSIVGMFGSGFKTFNRFESPEWTNQMRSFVKALIDIKDMSDDDLIFERIESVTKNPINGLQTGSLCIMLHCLKPYTFPIINGNEKMGDPFDRLELGLKNKKTATDYINNCRLIKRFRDQYLPFKNYRIIDLWYRENASRFLAPSDSKNSPGDTTGSKKMNNTQFDHNIILYGPPGTGKTYHSAIYAVAICDGKTIDELTDYNAVMARYAELKAEGRIAFTTFHQSYGYEEFIEGIAPVIDTDSSKSDVMYKYKDGVFKEFCKKAAGTPSTKKLNQITNSNPAIWKVSLKGSGVNDVKTECFENGHMRIAWDGYGEDLSAVKDYPDGGRSILDAFANKMQIGDIVLSLCSQTTIDGIGVVTSDAMWDEKYSDYKRVRKIEWLITNVEEDITSLNKGKQLSDPTVYRLDMNQSDVEVLIEKIEAAQSLKPYIFIIDEINRGNISKIFGELITLIEPSKRKGMPEAMEASLPYTQKPFSVPSNVFILGTMNTADRSIALMDTALRRRFQFVEMMPDADVLRKIGADKVKAGGFELDVADLLEVINERIAFLYDREHTIGHAFFTGLQDDPSVEKIASIFAKSVIPLLQEYFYEDYQKIQLVLGDNGKSDENRKFIKDTKVAAKNVFKGSVDDVIDLPEKKYEINEDALMDIQSYIEIM